MYKRQNSKKKNVFKFGISDDCRLWAMPFCIAWKCTNFRFFSLSSICEIWLQWYQKVSNSIGLITVGQGPRHRIQSWIVSTNWCFTTFQKSRNQGPIHLCRVSNIYICNAAQIDKMNFLDAEFHTTLTLDTNFTYFLLRQRTYTLQYFVICKATFPFSFFFYSPLSVVMISLFHLLVARAEYLITWRPLA